MVSVFRRILIGDFIYRRELESSFRIFLGAKEINFSRRIKFSDNIWKRFTTDVYWLDFIFLRFPSVSEVRLAESKRDELSSVKWIFIQKAIMS